MSRRPLAPDALAFLRHLGATLRAVRREARLQQAHVGARAGLEGTRLGEIERGQLATSVARVFEIARALDVKLSDLFRRVEEAALDEHAVEAMRARLRGQLREAIDRLHFRDVELIAALVERLRKPPPAP